MMLTNMGFFKFPFPREENQRQHSKPGTVPRVAERKKHAIAVVE